MSLPAFHPQPPLFSLQALSGEVFAADDRYRLFAQQIYPLLVQARPPLESCYCQSNGRPAVEPVLLLGVSLLQFLERQPDRQAVDLLKYHLGWKFALNQEIHSEVFDPTVLVRFRERLEANQQGRLAFETVLGGLREAGLVPKRGKQRLDSTHVLGMISRMSALECVRASLRLALKELDKQVEAGQRPEFWRGLWERYVESQLDYRSPEATLREKMKQAGQDLLQLKSWVASLPAQVQSGDKVQLLERVFGENFQMVEDGGVAVIEKWVAGAVKNPHDPDVQWCTKQTGNDNKEWVGYKRQVAETVPEEPREPGEPTRAFLTSVVTQLATGSDEAGMEQTLKEQAEMRLDRPSELYVDGAYVSAGELAKAKAEGWELVGPAQPSAPRKQGLRAEAFEVEVEHKRAVCPAGKESTQCSRLEEQKSGKVSYRFEWSWQCRDCPLRAQCVGKGQSHRTLVVGEHHTLLQARRQEMQSEAFKEKMKQRNGIEGTHSELARGHGARRTRYRGLAKVTLEGYLLGAACNVKRWLRLLRWEIRKAAAGTQSVPQSS